MEQKKYTTVKRKWKQLSERERYKIEALSRHGLSPAEIGAALEPERDRRTIERELAQGKTQQLDCELRKKMVYLADVGQRKHEERAAIQNWSRSQTGGAY
jgi:IS30 family transposase